jgi:hypothetical protein
VAERDGDLHRQRKQREARKPPYIRPNPAHPAAPTSPQPAFCAPPTGYCNIAAMLGPAVSVNRIISTEIGARA